MLFVFLYLFCTFFLYYCVCFFMYFIVHAAFVRIKLMMMMIILCTSVCVASSTARTSRPTVQYVVISQQRATGATAAVAHGVL